MSSITKEINDTQGPSSSAFSSMNAFRKNNLNKIDPGLSCRISEEKRLKRIFKELRAKKKSTKRTTMKIDRSLDVDVDNYFNSVCYCCYCF